MLRWRGGACIGSAVGARSCMFTVSQANALCVDVQYIGKYTSRETATGGTPYKPYLRKHRDESIAHQLRDFGNDAMVHIKVPAAEEFERQVRGVGQACS